MRHRLILLIALAFLGIAPRSLEAQVDVIRGRVTDVEGKPLNGVLITATSIPGNVTRSARSDSRGNFRLNFPGGQGDYMMGYSLIGYNYRQFQLKRTVDQDVLIADTRLATMQLDTVITTAPVQQRVSRDEKATIDVSGTEREIAANAVPPELQGNLSALAASLPGVLLLPGTDGGPFGFSLLGLGADANSLTLNGLAFGANGLPRDAAVSASLTTSPYDASRGGFSGGNLNLTSGSGSNFKNRGMSLVTSAPQLQWTDLAAQALGTEYTNVSVGGVLAGPIVRNKSFYNVSYQLDHHASANQTLLNTSPLGLQTAGVAPDSVNRFVSILNASGIPIQGGPDRLNRYSENASVFGSIDIQPPSSLNGDSYGIAFNGSYGKQTPLAGSATQLGSSSGDRVDLGGGAQLRHNRYFGLILSETSLGGNYWRNYGDPFLVLPAGRVRVNSDLDDGARGVQNLVFGGNQGLYGASHTVGGTLQNTLSWFDEANKHRIKFTTELQYNGSLQNIDNNLAGTFAYNSLADFEAGRASSFTRQLTANERRTGLYGAAIALGDSWRKTPDLQIQYGFRLEGGQYVQSPQYNAEIERVFGRRNDQLPSPVMFSPRIGFSWTVGKVNEIAAFAGAFQAPRAIVRGGIGVFANSAQVGMVGSALDNTGLPSGVQQLVCSGDAVPIPDWSAYEGNLGAIPDRCADGTNGTVFANPSPNVALFAKGFTPQRSVRGNLSWQSPVLGARFTLNVDATYGLNLNRSQTVDLNFLPTRQFGIDAEGGRPVFVVPSSIDPTTGAIASRDARVSNKFNRVSETRSDLQSRGGQLQFRLSPIQRTPTRFGWSAAYTLLQAREQVPGFQSTAGDPLLTEWATNSTGAHQVNYNLRYNFFNYITVNWNGQFRSGSLWTPMVAGDINGDGYANDRAFIYRPTTARDSVLVSGLEQMLSTLQGGTRRCIDRQLGQIAERNSCRAPWSSSAALVISLDRAKFRLPPRTSVNFSLANPLGAADLLINGSDNLKGWGQNAQPDQSLYYVRGFDTVTKRFRYEVNQRFGQTRPQFLTLRAPVIMTFAMRVDLGPTRERQRLTQELDNGRRSAGVTMSFNQARGFGTGGLTNPITAILRQQDSLQLTLMQADSLAAMNRTYVYQTDSLWTPVARYLAALPQQYQQSAALDRYQRARRAQVDLLLKFAPAVMELLTPGQRRKLPSQISNALDPRVLRLIRDGTGIYVTGAGP